MIDQLTQALLWFMLLTLPPGRQGLVHIPRPEAIEMLRYPGVTRGTLQSQGACRVIQMGPKIRVI
jgi:hypothetical protein